MFMELYIRKRKGEKTVGLSFDMIDGGELAAQFQRALNEIGRNIMDPNTDPEAARGMTVNIKFKPSGTGTIEIEYEVKPKLVGAKKAKTTFLIGQDAKTGKIEMREYGASRRPVVAAVEPVGQQDCDPETGEIYETSRGPIDLREMA